MSKNQEIYKNVTEKLIKTIETNKILPWQLPWDKIDLGNQKNYRTMREYNGVNAFITSYMQAVNGYSAPYWLTAKEIEAKKGKLKPNQEGTAIIFFKVIESDDQDEKLDDDGNIIINKIGIVKDYTIYNLDQTEGIEFEVPELPNKHNHKEKLSNVINFVDKLKHIPRITNTDPNKAYYSVTDDFINMPKMSSFKKLQDYYSTLFHEITHSTGHRKRLDRFNNISLAAGETDLNRLSKDHKYAQEELVAEMGASFLCAKVGILSHTQDNSAAYLKHWLTAIKARPNMLISAAKYAEEAAKYVQGIKLNRENDLG